MTGLISGDLEQHIKGKGKGQATPRSYIRKGTLPFNLVSDLCART